MSNINQVFNNINIISFFCIFFGVVCHDECGLFKTGG